MYAHIQSYVFRMYWGSGGQWWKGGSADGSVDDNPVASHPRHRALFELKSVLSFYVQFWHSEANLNIPKISWYSQSPNILHKIGTFQNTVNFLGKILILLGFEFALCFFGFEMVAHGRFLQDIDVLHTVIESLRIIAGAGADKTETSR